MQSLLAISFLKHFVMAGEFAQPRIDYSEPLNVLRQQVKRLGGRGKDVRRGRTDGTSTRSAIMPTDSSTRTAGRQRHSSRNCSMKSIPPVSIVTTRL